jgi:succinoglycan biosynthesis transport protein ExoP
MDQRQFFLRDVLNVIFKHMRLLLLFPVAVLVVVIVGSYIWPATYESVAKVKVTRGREIAQADPTVTGGSGMMLTQLTSEDVNSEIEMMHSEDVLLATVTSPAFDPPLYKDPNFPYNSGPIAALMKTVGVAVRAGFELVGLVSPRTAEQAAMEELDGRLETELVRDSFVIEARLRMGSREKSQKILEVLLDEHKKHHIETFASPDSVKYFDELLQNSDKELKAAQQDLQAFQELNEISLLDTQKALLLANYTDAQRVLAQLEEAQNIISGDDVDSSVISTLSSETDSTVVREMQLRLLELLLERNRVQNSLGENHPTLQSLREQVRKAQQDLIEAIATTKELTVSKRDRVLAELQKLNATKAELDEKMRSVEFLTQNYGFYWSKREEAVVADAMTKNNVSNIKLISEPNLPAEPLYPRKVPNIIIGLIAGILGALLLAFLFDYLDHGLKTPEDLEAHLHLAPLASFFNRPGEKLNKQEAERLALLLDTFRDKTGKSIAVQITSAIPGEGASQVASSIAEAFAADPVGRTLLVDLNGDSGGRTAGPGITDVLLNQASIDNVFKSDSPLTIVGRGGGGESSTYLWGSDSMTHLLEELRRRYKRIVFSVPPVLRSHDGLKLANNVDDIVIVVRADSTRREVVTRALDMFGDNRSRVVGAVLTERTQKIPQAVYRRI